MPKLEMRTAILAKIESTYGVDPVPTGSANAMLVKNIDFNPLSAEMVSRDLVRPYMGNSDQLVANQRVEVTFEVEAVGSGTLGTAPAIAPLLRACGMAETVTASTKVEYKPVSNITDSVTIYCNKDGVLHKMTGCRGTVDLGINARQIPVFKFRFIGIYSAPTDTALPTAVYSSFQTPVVANTTNTTSFTLLGVSTFVLESFNFTLGNEINFRSLIGSEYVQIADRKPSAEVVVEAVSMSVFNAFTAALGTTTGTASLTHGPATKQVKIDLAKVDLGNPSYGNSNGITMLTLPLVVLPNSGDDDFTITFQ